MNNLATSLASSKRRFKCQICDRTVDRKSRQQQFCSTKCRMKAFRDKMPASMQDSGSVTNPRKFQSENNVLQWPKSGSSISCNGPLNLLGGGSWKWPDAGQLDIKTISKILRSEVGGELMGPPE